MLVQSILAQIFHVKWRNRWVKRNFLSSGVYFNSYIYIFTYLVNSLVHVFFPGRLGYDRFTPAKLHIVWVKLLWPGFGVVQWSYSCEFSSSKLSSVGSCHLKQVGLHVNGWSQLNMREVKVDNMSNASPRPQVPIQHMKMQMGRVTACMWKREAKGNKSSCRSAVHNNPRPETTMKKMKEYKSEQGPPQASLGLCPLLRSCFAGMKKWSKPMAFLQHLGHPGILGFSTKPPRQTGSP